MSSPSPIDPGRVRWQRIRDGGKVSYLLNQGVMRGFPMAVAVIAAVEVLSGAGPERLRDPALYERLLMAGGVFSAGGALSAWARWKGMEARYEETGDS